ncbi:hypothetical protein EMCRGX_G020001 [Ephydatia muelleri]
MAERKATNKYYPPEWTPDQGSLNTFRGSHPLRDRARKLHQGIMIMRFELPFNIWCSGCGEHIGMGVRYNAEKTRVGYYYTTPIFKFRMRCQYCANYFEIQTDPKNFEYVVVNGASRKNEKGELTEGESVSIEGKEEAAKIASDPMYRLEHHAEDEKKAEDATPRIGKLLVCEHMMWPVHNCIGLQALKEEMKDDFTLNQVLRKSFREKKAQIKAEVEKDEQLKSKASLSIPLVSEKQEDVSTARRTVFASSSSSEDSKRKRLDIKLQPIFSSSSSSSSSTTDTPERKRAKIALLKACKTAKGTQVEKNITVSSKKVTKSVLGIRRKSE